MLTEQVLKGIEKLKNLQENEAVIFDLFKEMLNKTEDIKDRYNPNCYQYRYVFDLYSEIKDHDHNKISNEGINNYLKSIREKITYSPKTYSMEALTNWLIKKTPTKVSILQHIDDSTESPETGVKSEDSDINDEPFKRSKNRKK